MGREQRAKKWQEKTKNSPFAVNLVAEDERIFEENAIREQDESERRQRTQALKETAKNEILLKALGEFSELEALRREKRAILDEEQRLRALLALEKVPQFVILFLVFLTNSSSMRSFINAFLQVTVHGKADRLVAERAQKQRKDAKFEHRRSLYKVFLASITYQPTQLSHLLSSST